MPGISASDYTKYLKFKAAAATPIGRPIQTRDNVTLSQSVLNANILASSAAQAVAPQLTSVYASKTTSFTYIGSDQTFVVPPTVRSITVSLSGAGGETASTGSNQGEGGAGGYVAGTLGVSPGEALTIVVGGKSGYGGGGAAGGTGAGSGGGRTAILRKGVDIVTAGGGGGGGAKTQGGIGGGAVGTSGAAIGGVSTPVQSVVDSAGNLFVANFSRHTILKITPSGSVSVFSGVDGTSGSTDTAGGTPKFNNPQGLAIDSSDNLYVGDAGNYKIRKITSAGVVTTIAGTGSSGSANNATGTSASFNKPVGLALVGTTLYVADQSNNKIRAVALTGTFAVTTPYGSGTAGSADGNGTSATFNDPYGITTDGTDLYVSDAAGNKIRKITLGTTAVTTLAGSTSGNTDNATGTSAQFNSPRGITTDGSTIYVADAGNNSIRAVSLTSPYAVTTYSGGSAGWTGRTISTALYTAPLSVTYSAGIIYVSDGNDLIRKIVVATGSVTDMIVDATGGTQSAVGTGGTGAGTASGTTGGAGKTGDQAGGGGGGYFGGGGGTTSAAGAGGSSYVGGFDSVTANIQGGGAASNTDGSITITYTYAYKEVSSPNPGAVNNPNALSTVGYAGTSGALSSSRFNRPGGLPTGFKNSQGTYTRLPQNAGWSQGGAANVSSGPKRF